MDKNKNGLEINEAAQILEISVEALRKRIQRGKLDGYKVDGRWYVVLDNMDNIQDKPDNLSWTEQDNVQDKNENVTAYQQLVNSLNDEIVFLRQELSARTEENRRKDHIIAGLTQRIPELPSGQVNEADTIREEILQEVHTQMSVTIDRLEQQEREKEARLEERDHKLMEALRTIQETKQQPQSKNWWPWRK